MVIYLLTTICGFTPQAIAKKGVRDTTDPLAKMPNKKHGAGVSSAQDLEAPWAFAERLLEPVLHAWPQINSWKCYQEDKEMQVPLQCMFWETL